jgi:hypothetical protein
VILKSPIQYAREGAAQILGAPLVQASTVPITIASLIAAVASAADATTYSVGSHTIAANQLGLLAILAAKTGGTDAPTFTGSLGGTWDLIDAQAVDADRMLRIYRSLQGTSRTGTIIINFATTHEACAHAVAGFTGINPSGSNGAGAIGQVVKTSVVNQSAIAISGMAPLGSGENLCIAIVGGDINTGFTEVAPFAQVSQAGNTPLAIRLQMVQAAGSNNPSWTHGLRDAGAIALEMRAA